MSKVKLNLLSQAEFAALNLTDKNQYLQDVARCIGEARGEANFIPLDRESLSRLRRFYARRRISDLALDKTSDPGLRGALRRYSEALHLGEVQKVIEHETPSQPTPLYREPPPDDAQLMFFVPTVHDAPLTHRDYARLGQIYVRLRDTELTISSPGGFMQGVTLDNLLRVEPTPRNPRLADAFKRLGLSERTGRGVDIIYEGTLRYGRPAPSYRGSTAQSVVVALDARPANLKFVEAVVEEERRRGRSLSVDALIVLGRLKDVKRATVAELAETLQSREVDDARAAVEELVETGLLQAHGTGKGRSYTMSAKLYGQLGRKAEHIRQTGFDAEQQRQMVLKFVKEHGKIRRAEVMELCGLSSDQSKRLLTQLAKEELLVGRGQGRGAYYEASEKTGSSGN